jgi:hypothetical protein
MSQPKLKWRRDDDYEDGWSAACGATDEAWRLLITQTRCYVLSRFGVALASHSRREHNLHDNVDAMAFIEARALELSGQFVSALL